MKPYIFIFLIVISLIFADVALYLHYWSWDIPTRELIPYTIFTVFAELVLCWSFFNYKEVVNPLSIYSVFIYTAGYSFITLADKQTPYSYNFSVILILSILFFVLGSVVSFKTPSFLIRSILPPLSPKVGLSFLLLVQAISCIVFVVEIKQLGYVPLLNLGNAKVYEDLVENEVSAIHNFIVLNSILPAMYFTFLKKRIINRRAFAALCFLAFFIILNYFSRQIIILFFFSLLLAYTYYNKISLYRLSAVLVVCVTIFVVLGQLRNQGGDDSAGDVINEVLKWISGIDKPTNLIETYLSMYGAVNFSTANKIINDATNDHYTTWGLYSFRNIISTLPVDKSQLYPLKYSAYSQLGTYIVDPYLDFSYIGVIILNFIYGFLSTNSFKNFTKKLGDYYIVEWSLFVFCIFMGSFTNYYHLFMVLFFFTVNRIALKR